MTDLSRPHPPLQLLIAGLAVLFGILAADGLHQITKGKVGAFNTYYDAAEALRDGRDPYAVHHGLYNYVYPPLYAFLWRPLLHLSRPAAARSMLVLNAGLILAALRLPAAAQSGGAVRRGAHGVVCGT